MCHTGRDETMQPAKPSFLEYFEQKEKEVNNHNDGGRRGENNADNRKLPGEGDLEMVSMKLTLQTAEREKGEKHGVYCNFTKHSVSCEAEVFSS